MPNNSLYSLNSLKKDKDLISSLLKNKFISKILFSITPEKVTDKTTLFPLLIYLEIKFPIFLGIIIVGISIISPKISSILYSSSNEFWSKTNNIISPPLFITLYAFFVYLQSSEWSTNIIEGESFVFLINDVFE